MKISIKHLGKPQVTVQTNIPLYYLVKVLAQVAFQYPVFYDGLFIYLLL